MQTPQAEPSATPARVASGRPMPTPEERTEATYQHVLRCALHVKEHRCGSPLSTGEALAGAIAAGNMRVLKDMGYSVPEALNRIGALWVAVLMSDRFAREFQS